jgi:hypothetical protein
VIVIFPVAILPVVVLLLEIVLHAPEGILLLAETIEMEDEVEATVGPLHAVLPQEGEETETEVVAQRPTTGGETVITTTEMTGTTEMI